MPTTGAYGFEEAGRLAGSNAANVGQARGRAVASR